VYPSVTETSCPLLALEISPVGVACRTCLRLTGHPPLSAYGICLPPSKCQRTCPPAAEMMASAWPVCASRPCLPFASAFYQ